MTLSDIVVGGRHFLLFPLLRAAEYTLYTHLIYHAYTLCIHKTMYMFSGLPGMTTGRPPTTVQSDVYSDRDYHVMAGLP